MSPLCLGGLFRYFHVVWHLLTCFASLCILFSCLLIISVYRDFSTAMLFANKVNSECIKLLTDARLQVALWILIGRKIFVTRLQKYFLVTLWFGSLSTYITKDFIDWSCKIGCPVIFGFEIAAAFPLMINSRGYLCWTCYVWSLFSETFVHFVFLSRHFM